MLAAAVLFALLCATSASAAEGLPSSRHDRFKRLAHKPTRDGTARGVIVQMFEWDWDSIARECTDFLGPAGYAYVQASPAQEHISDTSAWWSDYQPVSYKIASKRGNRDQYVHMIATCRAAGVGIVADTVLNHMSARDGGTGSGGSSFSHYNYPGLYTESDFHSCRRGVNNYQDRYEVQNCELDGLPDLATEMERVRAAQAAYANDLLSMGVVGLRLDAAKHIASEDLSNIIGRLTSRPYVTQEVTVGPNEAVKGQEYVGNGEVQEFHYTQALRDAFQGNNGGVASLMNIPHDGWLDSASANVFVANHDTERNGDGLNYKAGNGAYVLAHVFSLAHPYGRPTVLSSYAFDDFDAGAPRSGSGVCDSAGGKDGWLCQHRWQAIVGMLAFHNVVGNAPVGNMNVPSAGKSAFGRGNLGFVAINNEDADWSQTFATALPAGSYCDVVHGAMSGNMCTGVTYVVASDGTFAATVPRRNALAIHAGAVLPRGGSAPSGGQAEPAKEKQGGLLGLREDRIKDL